MMLSGDALIKYTNVMWFNSIYYVFEKNLEFLVRGGSTAMLTLKTLNVNNRL